MSIQEFIEKNYPNFFWNDTTAKQLAVDYAKYHVRKAVRAITRVQYDRASTKEVDELAQETIDHLYPLKNIK